MDHATPSATRTAFVGLILLVAYAYVFPYFPRIESPEERLTLYTTVSLVERGTYDISDVRSRWGWVDGTATHGGKYYAPTPPGTALLAYSGYWLYYRSVFVSDAEVDKATAMRAARTTGTILPFLLFLLAFYRFLGRETRSPVLRDAVFLGVAIGSTLYAYGMLLLPHAMAAALTFASFMNTYRARQGAGFYNKGAFLAGLFAGCALLFEYAAAPAFVVLLVYAASACRTPSGWFSLALGVGAPLAALLHFHASAFGSPFSPGFLHMETAGSGFVGVVFHGQAAHHLLFDSASGLLTLSPMLVFFLAGLVYGINRYGLRADTVTATLVVLATLGLVCFMPSWHGGWAIGPRRLALCIPFLGWLSLLGLSWLHDKLPRLTHIVALACLVAGVLMAGIPSVYFPYLPPDLALPIPELFPILVRHNYAPPNVLNMFGVWGVTSVIPAVAILWFAVVIAATAKPSISNVLALPLGLALALPSLLPRPNPQTDLTSVASVVRKWEPQGRDTPARLARDLADNGGGPSEYSRLADYYDAEGRFDDAAVAREQGKSGNIAAEN